MRDFLPVSFYFDPRCFVEVQCIMKFSQTSVLGKAWLVMRPSVNELDDNRSPQTHIVRINARERISKTDLNVTLESILAELKL